jgi:hypothetical protein
MRVVFRSCTFPLFRFRLGGAFRPVEGEVCCAVPNDVAVPAFVDENWTFEGAFDVRSAPDGFDLPLAHAAIRKTGFHVFLARSGPVPSRPARTGAAAV